jgi:hypothetical protein
MLSARELVLGAAVTNMPPKRYRKKKTTKKLVKKRLHIFINESAKAFPKWREVQEPWDFTSCEPFINWCHIFQSFLHS